MRQVACRVPRANPGHGRCGNVRIIEDDSLDEIQHDMADAQLRRLPVDDKRRVGMLSLADIAARSAGPARDDVANTLEGVSQPKRT